MFVGFKRAIIIPRDNDGKILGDGPIVIEGKTNKGATTSMDISGLSKDAVKVPGSDITYYLAQKGTGDVKADFGILDLPEEMSDLITGWKVKNKIAFAGVDLDAPYCSVLTQEKNLQDEVALLGFFRGKFTREKISAKTLDVEKTFEPEAETYTFAAGNSVDEGDQNGEVIGKYFGTEADALTSLAKMVLGEDGLQAVQTAKINLGFDIGVTVPSNNTPGPGSSAS